MSSLLVPKIALVATSVWGFYTLWIFGFFGNGTIQHIDDSVKKGQLPGTTIPFKVNTSLPALDNQLSVLLAFFWPVVDGSTPALSLQGFYFFGQLAAAIVIMLIEAKRQGWRVSSFVTTYFVIAQNVGAAATIGIWLALSLHLSPTVKGDHAEALLVDPIELGLLPLSITIGYITPTVLMVLPSPNILSHATKSNLVMFWQAFPIWIYVSQTILSTVARTMAGSKAKKTKSFVERKRATEAGLKGLTAFGLACAVLVHVITVTISGTAALFPSLFKPQYAAALHPYSVLVPTSPFSGAKARDVAEGSFWFLQWDFLTSSAAVLIWAMALRIQAKRYQSKNKVGSAVDWARPVLFVCILSCFVGPMGQALILYSERDSMVLRGEKEEKQEKGEKKRV